MGSHRVGHDWSDLAAAAPNIRNSRQLFVVWFQFFYFVKEEAITQNALEMSTLVHPFWLLVKLFWLVFVLFWPLSTLSSMCVCWALIQTSKAKYNTWHHTNHSKWWTPTIAEILNSNRHIPWWKIVSKFPQLRCHLEQQDHAWHPIHLLKRVYFSGQSKEGRF